MLALFFPAVAGHSALKSGEGQDREHRECRAISPTTFPWQVNHDDLRGVADIKTAVRFVNGQVIPTALAANGDFL